MNSSRFRRGIISTVVFSGFSFLAAVSVAMAQQPPPPTEPGAMTPAIDSTTSDDGATSMGVSLDGNQAAGSNRALALPDLAFSYYHVAGATMRPRASSSTYSYPGLGCTYLATGSDLFNTELLLPDGAVIKYLRVYYRDTNAAGSVTAWVRATTINPILVLLTSSVPLPQLLSPVGTDS